MSKTVPSGSELGGSKGCLSGGLAAMGPMVIAPLGAGSPPRPSISSVLDCVQAGVRGTAEPVVVVLASPLPAPIVRAFGDASWAGSAVLSAAVGAAVRELAVTLGERGGRINLVHFGPLDPDACCAGCAWAAPAAAIAPLRAAAMTRRPTTPAEVLATVEFLGGAAASYVNGITLAVDGGISGVRYQ